MDALHDLVSQIEEFANQTHSNPRQVLYSEGDIYVPRTDFLDDTNSFQKTHRHQSRHLDKILETDSKQEEDSPSTYKNRSYSKSDMRSTLNKKSFVSKSEALLSLLRQYSSSSDN